MDPQRIAARSGLSADEIARYSSIDSDELQLAADSFARKRESARSGRRTLAGALADLRARLVPARRR